MNLSYTNLRTLTSTLFLVYVVKIISVDSKKVRTEPL